MEQNEDCMRCQELLPWYVNDQIDAIEKRFVATHMASCTECRNQFELWSQIAQDTQRQVTIAPTFMPLLHSWTELKAKIPTTVPITKGTIVVNTPRAAKRPAAEPNPTPLRRAIPVLAATLLVAILSVVLFTVNHQRQAEHHATTASTAPTVAPSPLPCTNKANFPANASINKVAVVSATEAWAVGHIWDANGTTAPQTLIMHYQHCLWSPLAAAIPAADLYDIAMVSANEGWAVGATVKLDGDLRYSGNAFFVLHDVGGQWQRQDIAVGDTVLDAKIQLLPSGEGWILVDNGDQHTVAGGPNYTYTLLHHQSGSWTPILLSFKTKTTMLADIAAPSSGECWLVGQDINTGEAVLAHNKQGSWTTISNTSLDGTLYSIGFDSPTDGWAAGSFLAHYDGTNWVPQKVPAIPSSWQNEGLDTSVHNFFGMTMLSAAEGWAFTNLNSPARAASPKMLHYVNGQWQWVEVALNFTEIDKLVAASPTDGWAIGVRSVPY